MNICNLGIIKIAYYREMTSFYHLKLLFEFSSVFNLFFLQPKDESNKSFSFSHNHPLNQKTKQKNINRVQERVTENVFLWREKHFYHFEPVNLKFQSKASNLIQEQTKNYFIWSDLISRIFMNSIIISFKMNFLKKQTIYSENVWMR